MSWRPGFYQYLLTVFVKANLLFINMAEKINSEVSLFIILIIISLVLLTMEQYRSWKGLSNIFSV